MLALSALAGLLVTGCGDDDSSASGTPAARGKAVYERSCAACHGVDLRGTGRGPSQFSEVYNPGHHPDASYRAAIANGVSAHHWNFGPMPPVPGLSADDVTAVIAYIRQQQTKHGFEPYPPP